MRFEIGTLVIDAGDLTIARGARIIAAPPKVVRLLALLCARPGAIVSKGVLLAELWPDAAADDSALWQLVYLARKLLAENGAGSIETVPRRGYRLIATAPVAEGRPTPRAAVMRWGTVPALLCVAGTLGLLFGVPHPGRTSAPPPRALRAYRLGMYYLRLRTGDAARHAVAEMQTALRAAPADPVLLAGLAQTYVLEAIERPAERSAYAARAVATARRALVHDACSSDALAAIAAARALARSSDGTVEPLAPIAATFRRAIACDPRAATARMYYGAFLLEHGDVVGADEQLQRAVDLDPTLSYANVLLAEAELKRGDAASAIHYATEGLGFGTSDKVDALQTLGYAYARLHAFASATWAFRRLAIYAPRLAAEGFADIAHRTRSRWSRTRGQFAISSMRLPNGSSM